MEIFVHNKALNRECYQSGKWKVLNKENSRITSSLSMLNKTEGTE